ncbi:MAG: DNA-binding response regulator [Bacteroidetes bacterium]|jgi:two-component system LytT family response regulator|nr:DNA-binding response regulator [Bacteroidota bacterium]
MNALIIDDEKNGAEALQLLIARYCDGITVVGVEHSADSAIKSILRLKPDIVFLDIEMPTATGFDVIAATQQENYAVIFTTAYEQYAIRAFKAQAVDYLLKPIDVDELIKAVEHACNRVQSKQWKSIAGELNNLLKASPAKKVSISVNGGTQLISANEIVRLESDSNYTNVYLKNGQRFLVCKTLKVMADQLKDQNFVRVHSSHLINVNEIETYFKGDGGNLVLKNKESIPVSRKNKPELMARLGL